MQPCVRWRIVRPGGWLLAALTADVAILMTDAPTNRPVAWFVVDAWLAYRIWRGGPAALLWFRVFQTLGAVLFGIVVVMSLLFGTPGQDTHPGLVALFAVSAWCLMAPALLRHSHSTRHQRLNAQLSLSQSPMGSG
jgi:hypothetical protein